MRHQLEIKVIARLQRDGKSTERTPDYWMHMYRRCVWYWMDTPFNRGGDFYDKNATVDSTGDKILNAAPFFMGKFGDISGKRTENIHSGASCTRLTAGPVLFIGGASYDRYDCLVPSVDPVRVMFPHLECSQMSVTTMFTQPDNEVTTSSVPVLSAEPEPWSLHMHTANEVKYVEGVSTIVLFGGGTYHRCYNDVSVLRMSVSSNLPFGASWTRPTVSSGSDDCPVPRYGHSTVLWDGRLWVFGGRGLDEHLNDLHCLSSEGDEWSKSIAWRAVDAHGTAPSGRYQHGAWVVGEVPIMVVWGGSGWIDYFGHGRPKDRSTIFAFSFETEVLILWVAGSSLTFVLL